MIGSKTRWYSFPLWFSLVSRTEHIIGTSVKAAVVETTMMMLTIQPSCLNITPAIPEIIVNGTNTQSIVSVEAITEIPTSEVPCTAASLGFSPRSRWVVTFSRTTMASSTTMPMAMDRADMEMIFNELPVAKRYISEASRAIGILRTTMRVPLQRPRKTYTTSITTRKVIIMVSFKESMVLMILSDVSMTVTKEKSAGRVFSMFFMAFFTSRMTWTVLYPDCFWMMIWAPRVPFV